MHVVTFSFIALRQTALTLPVQVNGRDSVKDLRAQAAHIRCGGRLGSTVLPDS